LILIFANPFSTRKQKLDYYAEWYVYPYFSQNWNLFVPPPNVNYKLFVEYDDHGIQKKDIFQEILLQHQKNRLKGYGPLLLAFSNSIHYFEKATEQTKQLNGPIKDDKYFEIIEKSALNYLKHTYGNGIKDLKLTLVIEDIHSRRQRAYFN
jgi:hypothetical protein